MRYKKKPIEIDAIQYNNLNKAEIEAFVGKSLRQELESETAYLAGKGSPKFSLIIPTLEGDMKAMPGDYIIKGVAGEFYPCKPDIFKLTYDSCGNRMSRALVLGVVSDERDFQEEMIQDTERPDMIQDLHIGDTIAAIQHNLELARKEWYSGAVPHQGALEYLRKIAGLCVQAGEVYGMPARQRGAKLEYLQQDYLNELFKPRRLELPNPHLKTN